MEFCILIAIFSIVLGIAFKLALPPVAFLAGIRHSPRGLIFKKNNILRLLTSDEIYCDPAKSDGDMWSVSISEKGFLLEKADGLEIFETYTIQEIYLNLMGFMAPRSFYDLYVILPNIRLYELNGAGDREIDPYTIQEIYLT